MSVAYLKELAIKINNGLECTIILLSPVIRIPKELENFITILEMDYQTEDEICEDIKEFCVDYGITISESLLKEMALNFKGLTKSEIFSILSLAYSDDGELGKQDLKLIFEQKQQKIRNPVFWR